MAKSYTVTKNILYNLVSQFTLLLVGIFTSPYIIHHLGTDAYGVLSLVTVFIGYLSLLDFGLGTAIIKYISEYSARDDKENLEKVIQTSISLYIIIGAAGALIISILASTLATKWLTIPQNLIPITINVIYISALGFFINTMLAIFNSVPVALQRMDLTGTRNLIFGLVGNLGMVALLAVGQSLQTVVIWNVALGFIATVSFCFSHQKIIAWNLL
jgi:O-antigen/teichoic acid export membrane protein